MILNSILLSPCELDNKLWCHSADYNFLVKLAYLVCNVDSINLATSSMNNILNFVLHLKMDPSKVRLFFLLALQEKISTNTFLTKHRIMLSTICYMCKVKMNTLSTSSLQYC